MSELASVSSEEVKSELKRALITGDMFKAEQLVRNHPEAFTQLQRTEIMEVINRARFGVTDPETYGKIAELARKLSS